MSTDLSPDEFQERSKNAKKLATQFKNIEERASVIDTGLGSSTSLTKTSGEIKLEDDERKGMYAPTIRVKIDYWNDEGERLEIHTPRDSGVRGISTSTDKINELESKLSEMGLI